MTTPIPWEATLPQRPNRDGFGIDPRLNSELFQPDSKVTRGRRIAETLPDDRRMAFDMTRAQFLTWQAFYRVDLKGGFVPVTITDPVSGDPLDLLIVDRPSVERLAVNVWHVSFTFEEL